MNPRSTNSPKWNSILLPKSSTKFGAHCVTGVKISGYHMESLAIDAFKDYQGPLYPKNMLIHLLGHAMDAVKSPITNSTGQSRYVDDILGRADSGPRKLASTCFGQMRGKLNSCKTRAAFNALFCIGTKADGCGMVNVELLPKVKSKGKLNLLDEALTALFCSNRCPGDLILNTYDLAMAMRDAGVPVIRGSQRPGEGPFPWWC